MKRRLVSHLLFWTMALAHGAGFDQWGYEQEAEVPSLGLTRLALTPETFNAARPDLSDLRLLDAAGAEVPFVIERAPVGRAETRRLEAPASVLERRQTRITVSVPHAELLRRVRLESAESEFLKAVSLEAIDAAGGSQSLVHRQVIYRQRGADHLSLVISNLSSAVQSLRISLDDSNTSPIPITAVVLYEEEQVASSPTLFPARIVDRVEGNRETRFTIDLGAARLPLRGLRFDVEEPLFVRGINLVSREWEAGELRDRILGSGSIHRIDLEGIGRREALEVEMRSSPPAREVVIAVENGDSPPITLKSVTLLTEPTQLAFLATSAGRHRLLAGNPEAAAPRYDVAALAAPLRAAPARSVQLSRLISRTEYRRAPSLADIPLLGGAFDPEGWKFSRPVTIVTGGVQRLELPLHALANTRPDRADVRLVSEGRQLLYLEEQAAFSRAWEIPFSPVEVKGHRQLSRWELQLPQPRLPLRRVRVEVATTLFDREMRLIEERLETGAQPTALELGRARWMRTPDREGGWFEMTVTRAPASTRVWLETDNGDNAALELKHIQALIPAAQLLFQVREQGAVALYYGKPDAPAPRYDLSLVASRVLAAAKQDAKLADADPLAAASESRGKISSSAIFYGALVVVVAGLAFVIGKLVPKPSAANPN